MQAFERFDRAPLCADLTKDELIEILKFGITHESAYTAFEKSFAMGILRRLKFSGEMPSTPQLKTVDGDEYRVGLIAKAWGVCR